MRRGTRGEQAAGRDWQEAVAREQPRLLVDWDQVHPSHEPATALCKDGPLRRVCQCVGEGEEDGVELGGGEERCRVSGSGCRISGLGRRIRFRV